MLDRPDDEMLRRYRRVRNLFANAAYQGKQRTLTHAEWDISGSCETPVWSSHWSGRIGSQTLTYRVDLAVPCRKCGSCKRWKTMFWANRAMEEFKITSRTWWSTYTMRPEVHVRDAATLAVMMADQETPFWSQPPEVQFSMRYGIAVRRITKMAKRLRKGGFVIHGKRDSGRFPATPCRYLVVCEPHTMGDESPSGGANQGMPHFHAFWHEISPLHQLRKRWLEGQWAFGFSSHRLVDAEESQAKAWYLAKYIGKGNLGRVHCSLGYGDEEYIRREIRRQDLKDLSEMPLLQTSV